MPKTTKTAKPAKTTKTKTKAPKASKPAKAAPSRATFEEEETAPATHELDLSHSKNLFGKILLAVLLILVAGFFIKTAIWEYYYYNEKEGSARASATVVEEEEEPLIETEPTEAEVAEHTVPASNPRYLSIEKLNIKRARILSMGLKSNGELNTPANIFDVGWYDASGTPGSGRTLMLDGHNGGPNVIGVFKYLNKLFEGDLIKIERGDGEIFTYKVVENKEVALSESDSYMKTALTSAVPGVEGLTLISCTGEWSQTQRTYLSRQFVRAVLVEE